MPAYRSHAEYLLFSSSSPCPMFERTSAYKQRRIPVAQSSNLSGHVVRPLFMQYAEIRACSSSTFSLRSRRSYSNEDRLTTTDNEHDFVSPVEEMSSLSLEAVECKYSDQSAIVFRQRQPPNQSCLLLFTLESSSTIKTATTTSVSCLTTSNSNTSTCKESICFRIRRIKPRRVQQLRIFFFALH